MTSPAAPPPITLALMRTVVTNRANDIEDEEERDVRFGFKPRPAGIRLEEARVMRKLGELIDRIRSAPPAVLEQLGFKAKGGEG